MHGKKEKEPQPPLYGMIGKWHFGRFANMKGPLEEENEEIQSRNIVEEENNEAKEDDKHGFYDIVDDI